MFFKKIYIALLLASAIFLCASCASSSHSSVAEKEYTDVYTDGVLTEAIYEEETEEQTEESTESAVGDEECPHEFGEWITVTEPQCLGVEGLRKSECSLCGAIKRETLLYEGHIHVVEDAEIEATCKKTGLTAGKRCLSCGEVLEAQSVIPLRSHTYDDDSDAVCNVCEFHRDVSCKHTDFTVLPAKDPSCTETGLTEGRVCNICTDILAEQMLIDATGHTEVIDKGYAPTEDEEGLTDGKHCSVCDTVLISQRPISPTGFTNVERYESNYAYNSLSSFAKGEAMTTLYEMIDEAAENFHLNTTINISLTNGRYVVANINYSELGLSSDDALTVWSFYKSDHPLYYWISGTVTYNSKRISLITSAQYAKGEDREEYNKLVFDSVRYYVGLVDGETSQYRIALALHDAIITDIDYAYESDGVTPEDAEWAHNIVGAFENKRGVCESYAKLYQLLLNYCKVENIYVIGESHGEDHAWNMVKMDNGEWYWFDLTWDDLPGWMFGITYNYFCVTDTQDVSWVDGPWSSPSKTFSSTHAPLTTSGEGIECLYALPKRASKAIDLDGETILRETFSHEKLKYAVIGYNKVQLVGATVGGNVTVPEVVIYDDVEYSVVSIGAIDGKLLTTDPIETGWVAIRSITIPESVSFIWDKALMISGLTEINVDEDNATYRSLDGVLFTKSLYMLVQYPIGSGAKEYTIPDETVELANFSFGHGSSGKLRKLTFGSGLRFVGSMNAGYGYRDADEGELHSSTGDFFYIFGMMDFSGTIAVDEDNAYFVIENDALYNADKTVLHALMNRKATSFECADTVEVIDVGAFFYCSSLRSLTLPETLEEIRTYAIGYCSALRTVSFEGSEAEWNAIDKHSNWTYHSYSFSVSIVPKTEENE